VCLVWVTHTALVTQNATAHLGLLYLDMGDRDKAADEYKQLQPLNARLAERLSQKIPEFSQLEIPSRLRLAKLLNYRPAQFQMILSQSHPLALLLDAIFIGAVVALIVINLKYFILPNAITYPGCAVAIVARACANPCSQIDEEPENSRARYLTVEEQTKLFAVLKAELGFLNAPITVTLGTGMRKGIELLKLKVEHLISVLVQCSILYVAAARRYHPIG
jgi:hypothetical protein